MSSLNYKYLHYFWMVAREGSIARACLKLHVTQPAISTQLRKLERQLGEQLFVKSGRNLALTDVGQVVYRYADEIFSLGRELTDTLQGRPTGRPMRLVVGVADSLPKLLVSRLIAPALQMEEPVRLHLREDRPERLLAALAIHELDLVLSDSPLPPGLNVRAYNHLLGECGVTFFAAAPLAARYAPDFPASLEQAPLLLPAETATLRRGLEDWAQQEGIHLAPVAEIEDSAVLKSFGQMGMGIFAAPTAVEGEVQRQYRVEVVGRIESIRERVYAISIQRRLRNPAVLAISTAARDEVFS